MRRVRPHVFVSIRFQCGLHPYSTGTRSRRSNLPVSIRFQSGLQSHSPSFITSSPTCICFNPLWTRNPPHQYICKKFYKEREQFQSALDTAFILNNCCGVLVDAVGFQSAFDAFLCSLGLLLTKGKRISIRFIVAFIFTSLQILTGTYARSFNPLYTRK